MASVATSLAPLLHSRFLVGLAKSFGVILASEIGDKTFFIAAVMAMRNPRMTVRRALAPTCRPHRCLSVPLTSSITCRCLPVQWELLQL